MQNKEKSEQYTTWGYAKLLQHTDVLYDIQHKKEFHPIQIQLCPTETCESDCPFCAVGYRPYKSSMPWDKLEKCVRDFKALGAKSLEITGGGNPMLYKDKTTGKDINDIIRLGKELGLDIGIITNSHKLNKIDPTLFDSINWLRVSLIKLDENVTPEDYDFANFPYEKLGFSYIIYDEAEGCRTGKKYIGTTEQTIQNIGKLIDLHPSIKFVRIAGNSLIPGFNEECRLKWEALLESVDRNRKIFIKDIQLNDFPYDNGCYVGMIRPFIAASPKGDGRYLVYICNSHVLFSNQTYDEKYSLCEVGEIIPTWAALNAKFAQDGYPYEIDGNKGKSWCQTCKLCFYQPNNELLHHVVSDIPDKNFP